MGCLLTHRTGIAIHDAGKGAELAAPVGLLAFHGLTLHFLLLSYEGTVGNVLGGRRTHRTGIAIHDAGKGAELAGPVGLLLVGGSGLWVR